LFCLDKKPKACFNCKMEIASKNPTSWPRFGQKLNQHEALYPIPMRVQARLDGAQTAKLLGFSEHDIPVLVRRGLLTPLGKPVPNAVKYFAACIIEELATDPKWLNQATQVIYEYWKGKNDRKTVNIPKADKSSGDISITE